MRGRLRKLKRKEHEVITTKTDKKMKRSLLGGANTLTDDVIETFSSFYGKAIRDHANGNVQDMQNAIWATHYQLTSTNKEHCHQYCPKGEDSWCFFNRAYALQLQESEKDHNKKKLYLAKIPKQKLVYLKAVYKYLADPSLLQTRRKGNTQNFNESIQARVWNKCSKAKFCGSIKPLFIAKLTALVHNFGYEEANIINQLFGIELTLQEIMEWMDQERGKHATPRVKKRKLEKKDDSYQPGQF